MQFAGDQAILAAQQGRRDQRRTRIERRISAHQWRDDPDIGLRQLLRPRIKRRRKEPFDAASPFAAPRRRLARKIIKAASRMRLDKAQRRGLPAEVSQDSRQENMLEDIGEIAGVEIMRVVHGKDLSLTAAPARKPAQTDSRAARLPGRRENRADPSRSRSAPPAGRRARRRRRSCRAAACCWRR